MKLIIYKIFFGCILLSSLVLGQVPTTEELDAAIYPNAKYTSEQSLVGARVSTKVFTSNDPLSEVVNFYAKEFGKEAETEDNIFFGFQKYSTKYPDDVVYFYTDEKSMTKIVFQIVGR